MTQVTEVRDDVSFGGGGMVDLLTADLAAARTKAQGDSSSQILHKYGTYYNTIFVLAHDIKDGDQWRFSRDSIQRLARVSRSLADQPEMTPKMLRSHLALAHRKASAMLVAAQGSEGVRPTITAAVEKAILYLETQDDACTVAYQGGGSRSSAVAAPAAEHEDGPLIPKKRRVAAPGGGGGSVVPSVNPKVVRLAGGVGSGYSKCNDAKHDPAKGGDPQAYCSYDHTHFGCAQPDPNVLLQAKNKAGAAPGGPGGRRRRDKKKK
jgi:hypothetical protein